MDGQSSASKGNNKAFFSFAFGSMCFLTLFCIAVIVKNDFSGNRYISMSNIISILGLLFITLLSGILFLKEKADTRPMRYFVLILLNIYIANFFSALAISLYRLPDQTRLITLLITMSYFFSMSIFLTLWLYQKQFLENSAVTRAVTIFLSTVLAFYDALLIINLSKPILFLVTEEGVPSYNVVDYITIITDFSCLLLLCVATFSSTQNRNRKFSFLCCIVVPVMFSILSLNHELLSRDIYYWGVMCINVMLPLCLIFFNAHDELENNALRNEAEQTKLRISSMISQMQPHFLYNSLAVIAALCEEDPKLAAEATNAFSKYLRENMDFADKSNPIPFSEELNHIKTYVWLEKLRFPNKLNIEYDINCMAFSVPALSVQPMVENAIKHGICKKRTGGTIRIRSFEGEHFYGVSISDDGIGFDVREKHEDGKQHLGIKNTRYRIREMLGGSLDITSSPGEGTIVSIRIPK